MQIKTINKIAQNQSKLFSNWINVDVILSDSNGSEVTAQNDAVKIDCEINVKYAEYGIADIQVKPVGKTNLICQIKDEKSTTYQNIEVDLEKIHTSNDKIYRGIYVKGPMLIILNDDMQINYDKSYLVINA